MSNKTKLIIVIVALAVALIACVATALILGGAFEKETGNGAPTTEPTSEVADPTGENADPSGDTPTEPIASTDPNASTEPTKATDPTQPSTGSQSADKQPGDIQIGIDDGSNDSTPSGDSSSSGGGTSGGVINFGDLIAAAGD